MDRKIVNTEDNDTLNPMADIRNYGAGKEAAHIDRIDDEEDEDIDTKPEDAGDDKPMPDELAEPEETDGKNEKP